MSDLLQGTKRAPRTRGVGRQVVLSLAVLAALSLVAYWMFRRATSQPATQGTLPAALLLAAPDRLTLGDASLERRGTLWLLRMAGDPYTMGAAHARLLGDLAVTEDGHLDAAILDDGPQGFFARMRGELARRWRFRLLAGAIPLRFRHEMAGMAAQRQALGLAGPDAYQGLLWRQAALDIGHAEGGVAPHGGVASGLAVLLGGEGTGGRLVVGSTLATPGIEPPREVLVTLAKPRDQIPYARVGWPGQIGVTTGINQAGIAVVVNPGISDDLRATAAALPASLLARRILEEAHSLEEALAILKATRPLGAASFLVVDGNASSFAVVERSPDHMSVSRPKASTVVSDVLVSAEFAHDAENDRVRRLGASSRRHERLYELLRQATRVGPKGSSDGAAAVAHLLRDRRGKGDAALPVGNGNAIDDPEAIYAVVIDAAALALWISEGPGATGRFRVLDLHHELAQIGDRPAPLAELPAETSPGEPEAAAAVVLARRAFRSARRLFRQGNAMGAREAVTRALFLAPELAEPHKLAGDLARLAGDHAAARTHYERFLSLMPADENAAVDARAYLGTP
jgi:hypothetical protein